VRTFLWLGGAALLGVAALSVYAAFRSPDFVAVLTSLAVAAAAKAVVPVITKPLSEEDLRERQKAYRRGDDGWLRKRLGSLRD